MLVTYDRFPLSPIPNNPTTRLSLWVNAYWSIEKAEVAKPSVNAATHLHAFCLISRYHEEIATLHKGCSICASYSNWRTSCSIVHFILMGRSECCGKSKVAPARVPSSACLPQTPVSRLKPSLNTLQINTIYIMLIFSIPPQQGAQRSLGSVV